MNQSMHAETEAPSKSEWSLSSEIQPVSSVRWFERGVFLLLAGAAGLGLFALYLNAMGSLETRLSGPIDRNQSQENTDSAQSDIVTGE